MNEGTVTVDKKNISGLAVAYAAYLEAALSGKQDSETDNGVILWGKQLLKHQAATGVELQRTHVVELCIESAERRERARARAVTVAVAIAA